jgi:predicted metal-dependent phosphoesterase TrpH
VLKADLHVHSAYSFDCRTSLQGIISACQKRGINCIAVADHASAEGGLKLQGLTSIRVIVAEEVLTPHGEIMGMFLKETVPSPLSAEEAIKRIHGQGGLVCVPHPYDRLRPSAYNGKDLIAIMPSVDVIEVLNSRSLMPGVSSKAFNLAREYNKPASAGSDAHTPQEIGNAYVEIPEFTTPQDFLKSLSQGRIVGKQAGLSVHFASTMAKLKRHKPEE